MTEIKAPEDLIKFLDHKFDDTQIIEEARRRKAYTNEHKEENSGCMDPLATLGDAVLDTVVVMKLYRENIRTKEDITKEKIELVRYERTRAFAEKHNLGQYVLWGKGEDKQMDAVSKGKAFDDVTEALIGAIFLDAQNAGKNGLQIVQDFLERKNFFD